MEGTVGDRGPALAAARRYLRTSDDDLFSAIKNGIPGTRMPPALISEHDVWKIVAYIGSLRATASDEFVAAMRRTGRKCFEPKAVARNVTCSRAVGDCFGPDLSNIGAERNLHDLRETLTKARPNIPRGYQPVRITSKSGATIEGIAKNEDNFTLQVLDKNLELHLLRREEVDRIEYKKESLMPYRYGTTLTKDELQDLLAFLSHQVRQ